MAGLAELQQTIRRFIIAVLRAARAHLAACRRPGARLRVAA